VVEPVVLPRPEHTLSRKDIDADAIKVLHRLHGEGFVAYLVGGSVRDLLLGRRPKDFDIGTSAHPYQVKRLFRNCWIIGRRFRLAHVKFGTKTIEVATFRRQVPLGAVEPAEPLSPEQDLEGVEPTAEPRPIERDNEFGTPEEDAFRRDFTVNALFYDIGTLSIIDYTGGLDDLRGRVLRCIGDPDVRFVEDPVRMLRALVLAARLGFTVDAESLDAIARKADLITQAAPARLLEEYYKILRSGSARECFDHLADSGLLEYMSPELMNDEGQLTDAFEAMDVYRRRFDSAPETLTNAILAGTLLVPLGLLRRRTLRDADDVVREAPTQLGVMQVARRDIDRLRQILGLQRRLLDIDAPARAQRALLSRPAFRETLTWLDIHGRAPGVIAHWEAVMAEHQPVLHAADAAAAAEVEANRRRRRPRRRRPFART
jgi:poly(A) polymerase